MGIRARTSDRNLGFHNDLPLQALYDRRQSDSAGHIRNRNDSGKSDGKLYRLTGAEMARGPEFMRWCYDTGRADWKGGHRLLSELCEDLDHQSYMRDIYVINFYGFHSQSGMWFFGDCAFGPNGD